MTVYGRTLLLVVAFWAAAHGKSSETADEVVTSLLESHQRGRGVKQMLAIQAAASAWGMATAAEAVPVAATATGHSLGNLDKTVDKRIPSSAVEDWSLVCQQLCGAALGGAECSPYCKNMPVLTLKEQMQNANNLMGSSQENICPNLCGLQLGDEVCTCKNWITGDQHAMLQTTNVCAVFCDYNNVTLAGCSPCAKAAAAAAEAAPVVVKALSQKVGIQPADDAGTTTPDWNQLCASLCKTGDGGSLCNCDLSPFLV